MSTQETAALIESVNNMTATVAGKMGEIDQSVVDATNNFNQKINEVITSIPESHTVIYVNHETGDDNNTGLTSSAKLRTLDKALSIAATKRASTIKLGRVSDCQNNPYVVYDKHGFSGVQVTIYADNADGYTDSSGGAGLEAEQHKVPKITFTHKVGRNHIGRISMDDGRLSFGGYRTNVNLEWKITSGASLGFDGNAAFFMNDKAFLSSYVGNKILLNVDTSAAYYVNVGMFESTGVVRLSCLQGIEDKSAAQNNYLFGAFNSETLKGTRLFIENYQGNRALQDIIFGWSNFQTVPFTQLAQI